MTCCLTVGRRVAGFAGAVAAGAADGAAGRVAGFAGAGGFAADDASGDGAAAAVSTRRLRFLTVDMAGREALR